MTPIGEVAHRSPKPDVVLARRKSQAKRDDVRVSVPTTRNSFKSQRIHLLFRSKPVVGSIVLVMNS